MTFSDHYFLKCEHQCKLCWLLTVTHTIMKSRTYLQLQFLNIASLSGSKNGGRPRRKTALGLQSLLAHKLTLACCVYNRLSGLEQDWKVSESIHAELNAFCIFLAHEKSHYCPQWCKGLNKPSLQVARIQSMA